MLTCTCVRSAAVFLPTELTSAPVGLPSSKVSASLRLQFVYDDTVDFIPPHFLRFEFTLARELNGHFVWVLKHVRIAKDDTVITDDKAVWVRCPGGAGS
ncbi:MAG: hypothetical protein R8K20_11820 [Gallionellaceae bacterium]